MSKKSNATASKIISNKDNFIVGESYTYKQMCENGGVKTSSGEGKMKHMDIFNQLFNMEEYKVGNTAHFKILSKKEITQDQVEVIVAENRGKSEGSRNNYDGIFKDDLVNSLIYVCYSIAEERGAFKDDSDDFLIITSKHNIMCEMGIRNRHNTFIAKNQPKNFCNQLNLEEVVLDFAMTRINNNTNKAFEKALDSAVKGGLFIQENSMGVVRYKPKKWEKGVPIEWDTEQIIKGFAKKKERIDIELMKQKFANDMKFKSVGALHGTNNPTVISEFYDKVNEYTIKKYGIIESYPLIELHTKRSVLDNYLQRFVGISLEDLIYIGNMKFLNKQNGNFKISHTKYLKNGSSSKNAYVQGMDNFIEQVDKITYHTIYIDSPKLLILRNGDLVKDVLTGELKHNEYYDHQNPYIDYEEHFNCTVSKKI